MAGSAFKGHYFTGIERSPLMWPYLPDTDAAFSPNDLVFYDTADNTIDLYVADAAQILGWAQELVVAGVVDTPLRDDGKVLVELIEPGVEYGLPVNADVTDANEGKSYGLVRSAAGIWQVDLAETTILKVKIIRVLNPGSVSPAAPQIAIVHFLAASLQFSAIAS